ELEYKNCIQFSNKTKIRKIPQLFLSRNNLVQDSNNKITNDDLIYIQTFCTYALAEIKKYFSSSSLSHDLIPAFKAILRYFSETKLENALAPYPHLYMRIINNILNGPLIYCIYEHDIAKGLTPLSTDPSVKFLSFKSENPQLANLMKIIIWLKNSPQYWETFINLAKGDYFTQLTPVTIKIEPKDGTPFDYAVSLIDLLN